MLLGLVDYLGGPILSWMPLFYVLKLAFLIYLTIPNFEVCVPVPCAALLLPAPVCMLFLCTPPGLQPRLLPPRALPVPARAPH